VVLRGNFGAEAHEKSALWPKYSMSRRHTKMSWQN